MIGKIPSFHDYQRDAEERVLGRCSTCRYEGPMIKVMTGYECTKCHSMNVRLQLKDGTEWEQFR
jgi:Zn finger protein HypA/HybF involved in hydrogenase expression